MYIHFYKSLINFVYYDFLQETNCNCTLYLKKAYINTKSEYGPFREKSIKMVGPFILSKNVR